MRRIECWWFAHVDPLPLALTRIAVAAVALVMLGDWAAGGGEWLLDSGLVTSDAVNAWRARQPGFLVPAFAWSPLELDAALVATAAALACLAIGLFTRAAAAIAAFGMIAIQARAPFVLGGADALVRVDLMILALSPCGAALSLDARRRAVPASISAWPQRLIAWQTVVMYASTAAYKIMSPMWREGRALEMIFAHESFMRASSRGLPAWAAHGLAPRAMTYAIAAFELALPIALLWPRTRRTASVVGALFHLALECAMRTLLFGFAAMATYPAFFTRPALKDDSSG